jgi:cadmium resistance protein CadD (predicted permease)
MDVDEQVILTLLYSFINVKRELHLELYVGQVMWCASLVYGTMVLGHVLLLVLLVSCTFM